MDSFVQKPKWEVTMSIIPVPSVRFGTQNVGPGHRVYFTKRGSEVIVLLAGGDKRTQDADIRTALRLARSL